MVSSTTSPSGTTLSAAVLSGERIRAYLDAPITATERARARRAVDDLDVDRWRR